MSDLRLRRVFGAKKPATLIVSRFIEALKVPVGILDDKEQLVAGDPSADPTVRFPIRHNEALVGWAFGNGSAADVASLVEDLISAEMEKRAVAREALDAYRQLHLLYTLSEHLAASLNPESIALVALEEATRLIKASSAMVLVWNENHNNYEVIASLGKVYPLLINTEPDESLLDQIVHRGRAAIHNHVRGKRFFVLEDNKPLSLIGAPLKSGNISLGLVILISDPPIRYESGHLKLLNTVALQVAPFIEIGSLYAQQVALSNAFSRFVPHEFLRFLNKESVLDAQLGDHVRQDLALLVSDIRSFTALSENMSPRQNFDFINHYLGEVSPIIRQNDGFIVKYGGDSIMALFPGGVDDAVVAAVETIQQLDRLNDHLEDYVREPLKIGIGLHVGSMMLGIVGEKERMQGDVFSDAVNVAARMEQVTKHYKVNIAISKEALAMLQRPEVYKIRFLGDTPVRGRYTPVKVYEIAAN